MAAGICCPQVFAFLQPYPLLCLMILFFMSFLSIRLEAVWEALRQASLSILSLVALKMVVLPVILYGLFLYVMPEYALSALLLTAVSTGVVAPFMSNLVGGNSARVLVVTVITSILVPFSLPAVVGLVLAKSVSFSFWDMLRVLALAIFVPIAAVQILRRFAPHLLDSRQPPLLPGESRHVRLHHARCLLEIRRDLLQRPGPDRGGVPRGHRPVGDLRRGGHPLLPRQAAWKTAWQAPSCSRT